MRDLVDGCTYMRADGARGWIRMDGEWYTAVEDGRPVGSPCNHYLYDRAVIEMVERGDSPNWILRWSLDADSDLIKQLQVARLEPEDILVVTLGRDPQDDQELDRLARIINRTFPDNRAVILSPETTVKIYRPTEED